MIQARLTLTLGILAALLLAARSDIKKVYKKIGDTVILKPDVPLPNPIKIILWKYNDNIAVEWDGENIDAYRHFKNQTSLNISTGELTIRRLTPDFNAVYKHELNGIIKSSSVKLIVMYPVPKPEIFLSCNEEKAVCTLTCHGNITGVDDVTYKWSFDNIEQENGFKEYTITPESTGDKFICIMENPVSRESSEPIDNPFRKSQESTPKIHIGLIVFCCCLVFLVVVVVIHRVIAGMWFYQKDSPPWERDFWSKINNQEPQQANKDRQERGVMMGDREE